MDTGKIYCVYAHINKVNGKIYIGLTKDIKKRWVPRAYRGCTRFYNAIQKYGWDNFKHMVIIDDLTYEMAQIAELELIEKYKTMDPDKGYNIAHKAWDWIDYSPKKVYQYDLDGFFIKEWDSIFAAAKELNITGISDCCNGIVGRCGIWQWSFEKFDKIDPYVNNNIISHWKEYPVIYQFTTDGELVNTLEDIHIYENQRDRCSILEVCRGIRVQAFGYIWLFEQDNTAEGIQNAVQRYRNAYAGVNQYSLDGTFIRNYSNCKEASLVLGCTKDAINHACQGKTRKAFGFMWRYAKDCCGTENIEPYSNPNCRNIAQYTIDGKFVKIWESAYSANKYFGGGNVTNGLRKKSHEAYGYLWFFLDELNDQYDFDLEPITF